MKQTIMWLGLTLLFAMSVTLSITAGAFRPATTVEATESAAAAKATHPNDTANMTPAQPEVPVALLDDVPPRPAIAPEALARWIVDPSASPATRAAETAVPPATTATIAGQPWQDSKAGIRPPEGEAPSTQKPGKRLKGTANTRACGSPPGRFADLLRRLNLAPRCTNRRSAA